MCVYVCVCVTQNTHTHIHTHTEKRKKSHRDTTERDTLTNTHTAHTHSQTFVDRGTCIHHMHTRTYFFYIRTHVHTQNMLTQDKSGAIEKCELVRLAEVLMFLLCRERE